MMRANRIVMCLTAIKEYNDTVELCMYCIDIRGVYSELNMTCLPLIICLLTFAVPSLVAGCDCDYHPGGCSISRAAFTGSACQCKYLGGWTCGGSIVKCRDSSSQYCKNPDRSYNSCLQGGGDCEGYPCDCDYHPGGCKISKLPAADSACKCVYKGAWTCGGSVTSCVDATSQYCKKPDYTKKTCEQGNGDCGGY